MPRLILDIWHGERNIDIAEWKRRHGLWGVIVKCGGSDDPKWGRYEETTWVQHVTQAHSLGLHVGAYYYSDALTAADALADAKHCVEECMRGMTIDMPIYLDIEEPSQLNLPMHQLTDVVTTFCEYARKSGYQVGIYSGYEGFHNMFESSVASYSLWVAAWRTSWPIWAKDYDLWQEGSMNIDGQRFHKDNEVDGAGKVDLDWASDGFVRRIEGGAMPRRTIDPANVAALIHYDMVTDPRNGYNQQPVRWGGNHPDGVKVLDIDGRRYEYALGDYDCSSSVITAWRQALRYTKYEGLLKDATYTGDMRNAFCGTGLFRAAYSPAKRGDLYLAEEKHTAMCQDGGGDGVYGRDCLTEFNRNENHAASYGQVGDQDGYESVFRGYYDDGWNTVLHYVGGLLDDVTQKDERPREENVGPVFVKLDGDNTEHIFNPWAGTLRAIANADEKRGVTDLYALAGVKVPQEPKALGTAEAPLGARANDALSRGANFRGFERFEKHPSTRMVVRDEVQRALDKTPIAKLVREES